MVLQDFQQRPRAGHRHVEDPSGWQRRVRGLLHDIAAHQVEQVLDAAAKAGTLQCVSEPVE